LYDTLKAQSIRDIVTHSELSRHHFTQLYALCRYLRPKVIVETGVGLGTSSLFILQALEDNGEGTLYSIDKPYAEYQSDAGIDINESAYCANDGHYRNMLQEYMLVWPHLQTCGVLASHDVEWNTAFQDFADTVLQQPIISHNMGLIIAS
jgi:predicted O-methyltransferase YrrM